ncbi:MAG: hypothetical protein ABIC19_02970 [Patescibacteria group bacterium]|nr:hypothetical protein [Patescibacteria group bacterium]
MAQKGINFAQQTTLYRKKERKQALNKNLLICAVLIGLTFVVYGLFNIYKNNQEKELAGLKASIQQEQRSQNFEEIAGLIDTTTRLKFVADISQKQKKWSALFHEIEGKMLRSIRLVAFEGASSYQIQASPDLTAAQQASAASISQMSDNNMKLSIVAPNLSDISKQVVALKESEKIQSVTIETISLEDNGLNLDLNIQLIPQALDRSGWPETPAKTESQSTQTPETPALTPEPEQGLPINQ